MSIQFPELGSSYSHRMQVSQGTIDAFAELSGDFSPLHMRDEFAKAQGFPGRVAHGNILGMLVSTLVGMKLGTDKVMLITQTLKFRQPVLAGAELEIVAVLDLVSESTQLGEFKFKISRGDALVADGKFQVKFLS